MGSPPGGSSMTDLCFPRGSCSPVEMCAVDLNFPRASFPPGELCAEILMEDRTRGFIVLASEDSRGCGCGRSPDGTDLGFPQVSCSPVEMCAVN